MFYQLYRLWDIIWWYAPSTTYIYTSSWLCVFFKCVCVVVIGVVVCLLFFVCCCVWVFFGFLR